MKFIVDVTPTVGADPTELAEQILDYLCGGDDYPTLIESCDSVDPGGEE